MQGDTYFMEMLDPGVIATSSIVVIEALLRREVWTRPHVVAALHSWHDNLRDTLGIIAPEWTYDCPRCLTHGDPTAANLMWRGIDPVLIDPVSPVEGRVPQIREVDMAKMVQSMCGWEVLVGGSQLPRREFFVWPEFLLRASEEETRRIIFWLGIAAMRAEQHLARDDDAVREWCRHLSRECLHAVGV